MPKLPHTLPEPDVDAQQRSELLQNFLIKHIAEQGVMPFAEFMEHCLYHPEWGYYTSAESIFGVDGDFVTAPEMGPFFALGIAQHLSALWLANQSQADVNQPIHLVEIGAGSGQLAFDLLKQWPYASVAVASYTIIERSPKLRERQLQKLTDLCAEKEVKLIHRDELPDQFEGLVIANEVMDALPVERIKVEADGIARLGVDWNQQQAAFEWRDIEVGDALLSQAEHRLKPIQNLISQSASPLPFTTEVHQSLIHWTQGLGKRLKRGALLLVDYGYTRAEFYHPQRGEGTLMCHFRHHAHDQPLRWPGLQDITAFVDFTTVAETADSVALDVMGYTTQGHFLMNSGVLQALESIADPLQLSVMAEQLRRLMLPGEMGERFQLMQLSKGFEHAGPGFEVDLRYRL